MKKAILLLIIAAISFAFVQLTDRFQKEEPEFIPPSKQRSGDAVKGFDYLITGNYLKSGIPYSFFILGKGRV